MIKEIALIKEGGIVALPTETVYGLAGDATNPKAIEKIYKLKNRPNTNPLIIHVANLYHAKELAHFNDMADKLASNFWPGPITMVLPKRDNSPIAIEATASMDTIAIRIPSHEIANKFLREAGIPIAAPSANISNYISPTEAEHVREAFDVPIIDGGKSVYGLESTIIDLTEPKPIILRHGFITKDAIAKVFECEVKDTNSNKILAPGMMKKHYAPNTLLRINATSLENGEIGLGFGEIDIGQRNLSPRGDLIEAASNLYSMLRALDSKAKQFGATKIAIAPIPSIGIGIAINDKLQRASFCHPSLDS